MCSLSVKVLSNYLHLQAHCDKLKAFRIAQFFQNSKIQKITVKKIFFQNFDTGFLLIGVFRVYSRSFIAKLAKTKKSISSEINPSFSREKKNESKVDFLAKKSRDHSVRKKLRSFSILKGTVFFSDLGLSNQTFRCR